MVLLSLDNVYEILSQLRNGSHIKLRCSLRLSGVCAVAVLAEILKKELIKHEVEFTGLPTGVLVEFEAMGVEYSLTDLAPGGCICPGREMAGLGVAYEAAKMKGVVEEKTLWPVAVGMSYYQELTARLTAGETTNSVCEWCLSLRRGLTAQITSLGCSTEGIFHTIASPFIFLNSSSLSAALKSDPAFTIQQHLLSHPRSVDRRINELLARAGISIASANENYTSVPGAVRQRIQEAFGAHTAFVFRSGHDLEFTALEHALLLLYYLHKGTPLQALLSFSERRLLSIQKGLHFHTLAGRIAQQAVSGYRKYGDYALFMLQGQAGATVPMLRHIWRILKAFLKERYGATPPCIVIFRQTGGRVGVYSEDVCVNSSQTEDVEYVDSKNLNGLLKSIVK